MKHLLIKNWREFQHYSKRNPPWIKLHRLILEDYDFLQLDDAARSHLVLIWLLAAGSDGRVVGDPKFIAERIGARSRVNVEALIAAGFLIPDGSDAPAVAPEDKAETEKKAAFRAQAGEIIAFLNEKAGRNFDLNGPNAEHVIARLREGESLDDMRAVIAKKCREWIGDEKMNKFLRPATLFNRTKYASYKGELVG